MPGTTFLVSTVTTIDPTRCATYHTAHWNPPDCPADMQRNILAYNARLPAVVAEYKAAGRDIVLHDVNAAAGWAPSDRWIWGIHFNSTGFDKMAAAWHGSITSSRPWAARAGLL